MDTVHRPENWDTRLSAHIADIITDTMLASWREAFLQRGMVIVREICPPELLTLLKNEVDRLISDYAVRRDMRLPTTSYTPRRLLSVKRGYIAEHSSLIPSLYRSSALLDLASRIAGEKVVLCPYDDEQFVISRMTEPGDTHGWHWDDYSYGMVWVIEAPPVADGGFVQCVPATRWDKSNPKLYETLCSNPIHSYELKSGDLYFLRSDSTLHGVYPLQKPSRRTILNFAWASMSDLSRNVDHETTDVVYTDVRPLEGV